MAPSLQTSNRVAAHITTEHSPLIKAKSMAFRWSRSPTFRAVAVAVAVAASVSTSTFALDLSVANCPDLLSLPTTLTEDTTLLLDVPTERFGDPTANWISCDEVSFYGFCSEISPSHLLRDERSSAPTCNRPVFPPWLYRRYLVLSRVSRSECQCSTTSLLWVLALTVSLTF